MHRLIFLVFFISSNAPAQNSDILLLRKHNKTITHFFHGSYIEFYTTEKMLVSGVVDSIKRDSLFLLYYDVRMVLNMFGTFSPDTMAVYTQQYAFNNVYSFPAKRRFNLITSGVLFMAGGAAYFLVNMVNTIREGDAPFGKDNLPHVIGAATAMGLGILLNKTQRTEYKLGKKYHLKLLPAATNTSLQH
jgi:hypothetical protein